MFVGTAECNWISLRKSSNNTPVVLCLKSKERNEMMLCPSVSTCKWISSTYCGTLSWNNLKRSTGLKNIRFNLLLLINLFSWTVLALKKKRNHNIWETKEKWKNVHFSEPQQLMCGLCQFFHWQLNIMLKNITTLTCKCCSYASPVPLWKILLFTLVFDCFPEDSNQPLILKKRGTEREKIT